jgi:hypothetical protein
MPEIKDVSPPTDEHGHDTTAALVTLEYLPPEARLELVKALHDAASRFGQEVEVESAYFDCRMGRVCIYQP